MMPGRLTSTLLSRKGYRNRCARALVQIFHPPAVDRNLQQQQKLAHEISGRFSVGFGRQQVAGPLAAAWLGG
jgi:hypothetical protein